MRVLQEAVGPRVRLFPAIKANAYGHGAALVAPVLAGLGYDTACVAHVREAAELLQEGRETGLRRLLVLAGMLPEEASLVAALAPRVEPVVSCEEQLEALAAAARAAQRRQRVGVHVQLDTGMSRQGALPAAMGRLLSLATGPLADALELRGVMTHFAAADEPDPAATRRQLALFLGTLAALPPLPAGVVRHAANSAGVLAHSSSHLEACRPGLAVYGLSPGPAVEAAARLRPVLRLVSRVTLLKRVPLGTPVSYGGSFVTTRPWTVLAVVAAGYGDGLARSQGGRMAALLAGVRCPQLGRVTMDQVVVDATEVPPAQLRLGMPAELLGPGQTADQLAAHAGTINYEIVTALSARVERRLVD